MGYVSSPTCLLTLLIGQCSRLHKPNEELVGQQQQQQDEPQPLVVLDQQAVGEPVRNIGKSGLGCRRESPREPRHRYAADHPQPREQVLPMAFRSSGRSRSVTASPVSPAQRMYPVGERLVLRAPDAVGHLFVQGVQQPLALPGVEGHAFFNGEVVGGQVRRLARQRL